LSLSIKSSFHDDAKLSVYRPTHLLGGGLKTVDELILKFSRKLRVDSLIINQLPNALLYDFGCCSPAYNFTRENLY